MHEITDISLASGLVETHKDEYNGEDYSVPDYQLRSERHEKRFEVAYD